MRARGVTLPEILVAMLIAGVLAAIALPTFLGARDRAKDQEARAAVVDAVTVAATIAAQNDGQIPADVHTRLAQAEPRLGTVALSAAAPPTGTVHVERQSAVQIVARATSRTGKVVLGSFDAATGQKSYGIGPVAQATTELTNLVTNPNIENGIGSGWTQMAAGPSTVNPRTQDVTWSAAGKASLRLTGTADGTANGYVRLMYNPVDVAPSATDRYTFCATIHVRRADSGFVRLKIMGRDGANAATDSHRDSAGIVDPGVTRRICVTSDPDIDTVRYELWILGQASSATGVFDYSVDAITMTAGVAAAVEPFDGTTVGGRWTGTPHASTSTGYAVAPN